MDARRALAALSIAWAVRAGRAIPVRWSVRPHRPAHPDSALPLVRKSPHGGADRPPHLARHATISSLCYPPLYGSPAVDGGLGPQHAAYRCERLVVQLHRVPIHAMLDAHSFFAPFQIATHFPTKRLRPHRPTQIAQHVGAPQRGYPVVHQSRVQPPQHVRLPKHHIDGSPLAPSAAPAIPARSYTPVSRTETMFVSAHLKIQTLDVSSSDTKTGTSGCAIPTPACASPGCDRRRTSDKALHNSAHIPTLPRSFLVPRSRALPLPCSLLPRPDTSSAASEPRPLLDTLASALAHPQHMPAKFRQSHLFGPQ